MVKKKRSHRSIIFALIIIAAILSISVYAVIQNSLAPLATREDKSVFTPKDNVVIQATTFNGNIKVQPSTGSQIEVIYQVSAPNGYQNDVTTLAKETANGNSTTINANAAIQINNGVAYTANLVINVPTSSKELKEVRESIEKMDAVQSVTLNVIFSGYIFPTWKDQIP